MAFDDYVKVDATYTPDEIRVYPNPNYYLTEPCVVAAGSGALKAGQAMGQVTATGLLKPYDDAVAPADGTEKCVGLLSSDLDCTDFDKDGELLVKGVVHDDKLTGLDAAGKVDLGARTFNNVTVF